MPPKRSAQILSLKFLGSPSTHCFPLPSKALPKGASLCKVFLFWHPNTLAGRVLPSSPSLPLGLLPPTVTDVLSN